MKVLVNLAADSHFRIEDHPSRRLTSNLKTKLASSFLVENDRNHFAIADS